MQPVKEIKNILTFSAPHVKVCHKEKKSSNLTMQGLMVEFLIFQ